MYARPCTGGQSFPCDYYHEPPTRGLGLELAGTNPFTSILDAMEARQGRFGKDKNSLGQ